MTSRYHSTAGHLHRPLIRRGCHGRSKTRSPSVLPGLWSMTRNLAGTPYHLNKCWVRGGSPLLFGNSCHQRRSVGCPAWGGFCLQQAQRECLADRKRKRCCMGLDQQFHSHKWLYSLRILPHASRRWGHPSTLSRQHSTTDRLHSANSWQAYPVGRTSSSAWALPALLRMLPHPPCMGFHHRMHSVLPRSGESCRNRTGRRRWWCHLEDRFFYRSNARPHRGQLHRMSKS
jgi:hypothetical protein